MRPPAIAETRYIPEFTRSSGPAGPIPWRKGEPHDTTRSRISRSTACPLLKAFDLDDYLTNGALDGLFSMEAQEEKKIRQHSKGGNR